MATIAPVRSSPGAGIDKAFWETLATGDTATGISPAGGAPIAGSIQATGTFNGGTSIALEGTNDGSNWASLKDLQGTAVALTEAGIAEFTTTCVSIRPGISGGSSDDVDVTIVLRG